MFCVCEQDERGHVTSVCGAHREVVRKERDYYEKKATEEKNELLMLANRLAVGVLVCDTTCENCKKNATELIKKYSHHI